MFLHWDTAVSNDLHEVYGIDSYAIPLADRPWWWWRSRLYGLLDRPDSRITKHLTKGTA